MNDKKVESANIHTSREQKFKKEKLREAKRDLILINNMDFAARNLTSIAGRFHLLENAKTYDINEIIDAGLVFDKKSTNNI